MKHSRFVHLHLHTDYSFLDGACRIEPLTERASQLKMPALAITDHGLMCGAVKFYKACAARGIKPIIGCEFYVSSGSRHDKGKKAAENYHMTLLARNYDGYVNLMKLNGLAYSEGFYRKPRIDRELLEKYSEGVTALSGCLQGHVSRLILDNRMKRAEQEALKYRDIFGDGHFFLEMMDTGIKEQKKVNREIKQISDNTGIKYVATNDCHYIGKDDAYAQEILMCIGTGKKIDDPSHMRFNADEYYLKSEEEMRSVFREYPAAVDNTLEVAEQCNLTLEFGNNFLPEYEVPGNMTKQEFLEKTCRENIPGRYGDDAGNEVSERLDMELEIINRLGFAGYFLICWDFVNFARNNDVPVGPGRGSGAGSIVSYLLGITNLDPLKYGLLFERFLNPDRKTMPDLDIDFADQGRDRVIDYVKDRYGIDRVGQISTFSTLKAKAAIKDVGRVLDVPFADVNKLTELIPLNETIFRSVEDVEELNRIYNSDERIRQVIDIARKIEGCKRQPSVHAAGVVIAKDDLSNFVPRGVSSDNRTVTQYEGDDLVELGLLKMDFLGLKNLTIIQRAVKNIKELKGKDFDVDRIDLNDGKTYELLNNAESIGVFQIESAGFRDLLRKLHITRFEDIIALVALHRPGVMASGMTDEFIERKKDQSRIKFPHPSLENILTETYGVILYQEQVMHVARRLAGFSPSQADDMRKAMSKKIPEVLQRLKNDFIEGAVKNDIPRGQAENIFDTLSKFGAYGFNKSHSAAYATIAYQTAFLKANYPTEYMCALLSCEVDDSDKVAMYIAESIRMGIEIEPPSVIKSGVNFSMESEGVIRYGLKAVKNVGVSAIEAIVKARKKGGDFKSFYDFCSRVDLQRVNKRVIESLIKAGAFDYLQTGRRPLTLVLDQAMAQAAAYQKDVKMGQTSFFEVIDGDTGPEIELEDTKEWHENELLAHEKEALGFYFSGHPLARYADDIDNLTSGKISIVKEHASSGMDVVLGGMVKHRKIIKTRRGDQMLAFILEDLSDTIEAVVFPSAHTPELAEKIQEDAMIVVRGQVDDRRGRRQCIAESVMPLEEARKQLVGKIVLRLNTVGTDNEGISRIKKIFDRYPGDISVEFEVKTKKFDTVRISTDTCARLSDTLLEELGRTVGKESVMLVGKSPKVAVS